MLLAAACGERPPVAPTSPPPAPPPPAPLRAVDTAALRETEVVDAVLAHCHAPLRGGMDRITATVTLPDGGEVQLFAELPDKLRVQSRTGMWLLRGERVARLDGATPPAAADVERVRRLRALLDAAAFGPLHRATACRRVGPAAFALTTPTGVVRLELRPDTLLPAVFGLADGTVRVLDYLRTPTTWIARELELDGLGRCRVHFASSSIAWAPDFFGETTADPAATAPPPTPAPRRTLPAVPGAEKESPVPVLTETRALRWALAPDPGDWPGRVAAYRPLHEELVRQEQAIAGFPVFFAEGERRWLAAPFRQRPEGAAFRAPAGWNVREVAAGRALVVWPPAGDLAERLAAGERLLAEALRTQGLRARGPVTAQPYFHLHEGEPTAARLAAPKVRMAVAVE